MNKFWKIVCWILFWYYLVPYYLLKKFVFKETKCKIRWSALSSIAILFLLFVWMVASTPDDSDEYTSSEAETHVVVKKVGTQRLKKAQSKQKVLKVEEKKKKAEYEKLASELEAVKTQKQKEEKEEKSKQAQVKNSQSTKKKSQTSNNNTDSTYNSENSGGGNKDLNTAQTSKIVGNRNTHIYHVPGQAGYKMNSANAVYFNSEQEAINAGYRKAKR